MHVKCENKQNAIMIFYMLNDFWNIYLAMRTTHISCDKYVINRKINIQIMYDVYKVVL